jgi:hypothetical protein
MAEKNSGSFFGVLPLMGVILFLVELAFVFVRCFSVDEAGERTILFRYPSVLPGQIEDSYIPRAVRIECGAKADP